MTIHAWKVYVWRFVYLIFGWYQCDIFFCFIVFAFIVLSSNFFVLKFVFWYECQYKHKHLSDIWCFKYWSCVYVDLPLYNYTLYLQMKQSNNEWELNFFRLLFFLHSFCSRKKFVVGRSVGAHLARIWLNLKSTTKTKIITSPAQKHKMFRSCHPRGSNGIWTT